MSININVNGNSNKKKGKTIKMVPTDSQRELEELNRRRIMRMQQVREQSKDIAANVRERVKKVKAKQQEKLEEESATRLKEWQNRKLLDLQGQYRESLKDIGLGHTQALIEENEEIEYIEKRDKHYKDQANSRGTMAKEKQQIEKNEESLRAAIPKQIKKMVRDSEDARAAMVCKTKRTSPIKNKSKSYKVPGVGDVSIDVDNNVSNLKGHKTGKSPKLKRHNRSSYDDDRAEVEQRVINYRNKNSDSSESNIDSEVEERVIDYNRGHRYRSPENLHYTSPTDEPDHTKRRREDRRSRSPRDYHKNDKDNYYKEDIPKTSNGKHSPQHRDRKNHKNMDDTEQSYYADDSKSQKYPNCCYKDGDDTYNSRSRRHPQHTLNNTDQIEDSRYSSKHPRTRYNRDSIQDSYLSDGDDTRVKDRTEKSMYSDDESMLPRRNLRTKNPDKQYLSTREEVPQSKRTSSRSPKEDVSRKNPTEFQSKRRTSRSPTIPKNQTKKNDHSPRSQDTAGSCLCKDGNSEKRKKNLTFEERKFSESSIQDSEEVSLDFPKDTRISDRIKSRKIPDIQPKLSVDQGIDVQQIDHSTQTLKDCACQVQEIPEKPTVSLKSASCDKSCSTRVPYYDHKNRYTGESMTDHSVHKISEDSIEVCVADNEAPGVYEKMKYKRDHDAEQRGKLAMEKVRIHKDYEDLVHKLPVLQKQERLASMNPNRDKLHMSNDRRKIQEKQRQNKMENAFEKLVANTITIPPKKRSSEESFNPGSWDNDVPNKSSSDISTEKLKSLLEKLKIQKEMLMMETEPGGSSLQNITDLEGSENVKAKPKLSSVSVSTSPIKKHKNLMKKGAKSPKRRTRRDVLILQNMSTQTSPPVKTSVSTETTTSKEDTPKDEPRNVACECKSIKVDENYCEILIKIPDKEKAEVVIKSPKKDSEIEAIKVKLGEEKKKQKYSKKKRAAKPKPVINKNKTWDDEFSKNNSSTSYMTPPEFSKTEDSKNFSNSSQEQENDFAKLLHKKPQQSNVSNESSSKDIDPKLLSYIKKLLNMSRGSIDDLNVSTVSEVSTPSSSIINMDSNNPRAKLMNVLKFCNIDINDLIENLSKSSTSTRNETSKNTTNNNNNNSQELTVEAYDETNYPQLISNHYDKMADQCQKRIQDINEKLLKVRAETRQMESPNTSDDKENTTYFNLPKSNDSTNSTSPEQRMLNNKLLTIDLDQLAEHLIKKSPRIISQDVDKDIADRYLKLLDEKPAAKEVDFVPLLNFDLQNVVKLPDVKHKKPPPTSKNLTVTRLKPELNFKPHELSTIAEGDSLRRSRSPEILVNVTASDGSQGTISKANSAVTSNLEAIEMMGLQMKIFNNLSGDAGSDKSISDQNKKSPKTVNFDSETKSSQPGPSAVKSPQSGPRVIQSPQPVPGAIKNFTPQASPKQNVRQNAVQHFSPQPGPSGLCKPPKITLEDIIKKIQDANSTDSSTDISEVDIEAMLRNMGMGWAATTIKKTRETLVQESSSSSMENKESSSDVSLIRGKNISSSTLKSDNSISPYLADFQNISAIHCSGSILEKQLRTSTPLQISKSSSSTTDCNFPIFLFSPQSRDIQREMNNTGSPTADDVLAAGDASTLHDQNLTEEEHLKREEEYKAELARIDDEIATLRTVLAAKMRRSAELKRLLGITVWKEVTDDINQGLKNVKDSNVYQTVESKVGQVTKAVTDAPIYQKTTSLIGGFTGGITNKIGQMRHSESFKSFEEKAASAIENVKTKVGGVSRSGSQQSLDDALRSRSGSVATSPTIPEDKPIA
ncbi:PREDICTED: uncharacterized protein LOC108567111 [Nicrophorus vespilloides]|uniref:Uncharacterized protein LOC108567111 n=1 Tax=Nicrophorus vespilloides TaxID=110193 RepID=A0ABM1N7S3_NICVS|nr:PREDICTED: uncharacterized protein LOC108567111 [Nicrophorus vespilloides]